LHTACSDHQEQAQDVITLDQNTDDFQAADVVFISKHAPVAVIVQAVVVRAHGHTTEVMLCPQNRTNATYNLLTAPLHSGTSVHTSATDALLDLLLAGAGVTETEIASIASVPTTMSPFRFGATGPHVATLAVLVRLKTPGASATPTTAVTVQRSTGTPEPGPRIPIKQPVVAPEWLSMPTARQRIRAADGAILECGVRLANGQSILWQNYYTPSVRRLMGDRNMYLLLQAFRDAGNGLHVGNERGDGANGNNGNMYSHGVSVRIPALVGPSAGILRKALTLASEVPLEPLEHLESLETLEDWGVGDTLHPDGIEHVLANEFRSMLC
jgi:hypothetical protein